jgi:hypothetical protein
MGRGRVKAFFVLMTSDGLLPSFVRWKKETIVSDSAEKS